MFCSPWLRLVVPECTPKTLVLAMRSQLPSVFSALAMGFGRGTGRSPSLAVEMLAAYKHSRLRKEYREPAVAPAA